MRAAYDERRPSAYTFGPRDTFNLTGAPTASSVAAVGELETTRPEGTWLLWTSRTFPRVQPCLRSARFAFATVRFLRVGTIQASSGPPACLTSIGTTIVGDARG